MSVRKYNTKKIDKQDLKAAREQLKKFRHDVSLLKKKGLIDKTRYDARKIIDTGASAKYLKSQIKKFSSILNGEATTAKVSKEKQKYYKEKGYQIKNGRVIVPIKENEKVTSTRGDFRITSHHPSGKITRIDLGLSKNDLDKWKEKILSKKIKLAKDERIAFQYFGNNSYQTFLNVEQLIEYLEFYDSFNKAEESADQSKQTEVIDNIVIFKIERSSAWEKSEYIGTEKHERQKERNRIRRERWFSHLTDAQYNRYMDKRADYERMRRANIKANPAKYEEERIKSRARAKKSHEKRKKK